MRPPQLLAAVLAACLALLSGVDSSAFVLPIAFQPLVAASNGSALLPLYTNISLDGVFVAGLGFGTPPQSLHLLIDTGSGITHVSGAGCGSSCGLGLPPSAGYNATASSTARRVPCGNTCSCPWCQCSVGADPQCVYTLQYADGSVSAGSMVRDEVGIAEQLRAPLMFGVDSQQAGKVQAMGIEGLLALDRSKNSFLGQLRAQNRSEFAAFGTCWELAFNDIEQGYPNDTAASFLMVGLPPKLMAAVQPQWTPVLPDSGGRWMVGLAAIEVAGPGGGNVTFNSTSSSGSGSSSTASTSGGSSGGGSKSSGSSAPAGLDEGQAGQAPLLVDSGTTFVNLPPPAWQRFQQLVASAAEQRGGAALVQAQPAATCWRLDSPGALATNASALAAAFPPITFHFGGGAAFSVDPRGYLTRPDNDPGQAYVCLSFFPWASSTSPSMAQTVLLGSRVRQRVLTLHDDTGAGRVGFVSVPDCQALADQWEAEMDAVPVASGSSSSGGGGEQVASATSRQLSSHLM